MRPAQWKIKDFLPGPCGGHGPSPCVSRRWVAVMAYERRQLHDAAAARAHLLRYMSDLESGLLAVIGLMAFDEIELSLVMLLYNRDHGRESSPPAHHVEGAPCSTAA